MATGRSKQRSDPFYEEPLQRAFYFPSPPRYMTTADKKIAIQSPDRSPVREKISPAEKDFLKGSNVFTKKTPLLYDENDNSSKFDESWPASERPSTMGTPGDDFPSPIVEQRGGIDTSGLFSKELSKFLQDPVKTHLEFDDVPVRDSYEFLKPKATKTRLNKATTGQKGELRDTGESTLSRYIDRFRHAPAMSREERDQMKASTKKDFWWLSSSPPTPSDSSTPRDETNVSKTKARTPHKSGAKSDATDHSTSSIPTLRKKYLMQHDQQTSLIQDKAAKLIAKSESSLNSSDPIVSTDGMSTSTGTQNTFDEEPYRPAFIRKSEKENIPVVLKPKKPEDDILVQWRMRRKMELARERAAGHSKLDKYKSEVKPNDVESKLAEFRKKLNEGIPGDCAGLPTKVSSKPEDKTVDDKVQNDAGIQTSPPESPPPRPVTPPSTEQHKVHIASPSIIKPRSTEKTVQPEAHYHLSCDILPCPHEHGNKTKKVTDDSDSSFERMKVKHVHQLRKEEDITDESYWDDVPEHDEKTPRNTLKAKAGTSAAKTVRNNDKQSVHFKKPKSGARSVDSKHHERRVRGTETLPAPPVQRSQSPTRTALSKTQPPSTSSPLNPPVNSAVGQVIRDRLFASSAEVMSSIDTTVRESPEQRSGHDREPEEGTAGAPDDLDELMEEGLNISDEEEFPEDPILKDLRQKRLHYVDQLQDIERKLSEMEV